jgi:hypothetical protein
MSNMSYCRFQNTLLALRDCSNNVLDCELSPEENEARAMLVAVAIDLLDQLGIATDLGALSVEQHIISAVEG